MAKLELPHTHGCLVCGRDNPHGLKLALHVDSQTGTVSTTFTPSASHIGFQGIVHGGVLATVLDEAMVWAATWTGRRFCVCGELTVRYRQSAVPGEPIVIAAQLDPRQSRLGARTRLIMASATIHTPGGTLVATGAGKYVPLDPDRHRAFVETLVDEPPVRTAMAHLREA